MRSRCERWLEATAMAVRNRAAGTAKTADGKMRDGYARVLKFAAASLVRKEAADVWLESGTIERFGDLPQLPFAASGFERASHEQDGPLHRNSSSALEP